MRFVFIFILVALVLLFLLAFQSGSIALAIADMLGAFVFLAVAAKCVVLARQRRAMMVLQCIEHSLRLRSPLPRMLEAAAKSESGALRVALISLSDSIRVGLPIADSLKIARCGVSPRVLMLIRSAEESGRLQPLLARVITEGRRSARSDSIDSVLMVIYPVFIILSLLALLGALSIFIMPKYVYIFEDFETQLPSLTVWFIQMAEPYGPALLAFAGLLGMVLIFKMYREVSGLEPMGFPGRHWLAWNLPVLRFSVRSRAYADAFGLMADSLDVGQTLPAALERAESGTQNRVFRRHLASLRIAVEGGAGLPEWKRQGHLPALASNMLGAGEFARLNETMRFLARHYRSRFSRLATVMQNALMPCIVLVLAGLVGLFVVSVFLPLVQLIDATVQAAL